MSKKNLVGNFFGSKNFGRKFFWVNKKFGSEICMAKFYFGLVRFVCDLLLITAKVEQQQHRVSLGGGGVWWVTRPYCSQTNFYLVMVELGFDNTSLI